MNDILKLLLDAKITAIPKNIDDHWGDEESGYSEIVFENETGAHYCLEYEESWSYDHEGYYDVYMCGFHIWKIIEGVQYLIHQWLNPLEVIYYLGVYGGENPTIIEKIERYPSLRE